MNRKLRICYFAPLNSVHTARWLDHFDGLGHEVYAFTGLNTGFRRWPIQETPQGESLSRMRTSGMFRVLRCIYHTQPFHEPLSLLRRMWLIRRHIAQVNPDIVHALWLWDNAFDAWLTGARPRVVTVWGSDIREVNTLPRTRQLRLVVALRFADAVTSGSKELLQLCQARGVKANRCCLIAVPGIDVARFEKPASKGILDDLGIPDGAEVILSCRAMQPFYRIHTIVSAFQCVHQQRPGTVLLILNYNENPPGYLGQVKRQIQEAGLQSSVRLLDAMPYDQMPELYAFSSVVVSIPEADGMPQCAYEALAAGCPIVASDLTTYDSVIDDGRTGLRVPGDDPEQGAQAILRILQDGSLRQRLVANGRQMVRERGDIHREMAKMQQLYYDLLAGSKARAKG